MGITSGSQAGSSFSAGAPDGGTATSALSGEGAVGWPALGESAPLSTSPAQDYTFALPPAGIHLFMLQPPPRGSGSLNYGFAPSSGSSSGGSTSPAGGASTSGSGSAPGRSAGGAASPSTPGSE